MPDLTKFYIRPAREDEIDRIREIEDKANEMFAGLQLIDESLDEGVPLESLKESIEKNRTWVACIGADMPIGMVIVSEMDGSVYIEEMDVLPAFARRGVGSMLLGYACEWAKQNCFSAVTLSTFRDVPWNAPFYRRHGFRDLKPDEWSRGMLLIREKEIDHGLRVEERVFMRRDLAG